MPGGREAGTVKGKYGCTDDEQSNVSDGTGFIREDDGMKIYVGIGPEQGKRVSEEDAFMYAMERVTTDPEDAREFCDSFTGVRYGKSSVEELAEFRKDLVGWYYSGNWMEEEDAEKL